MRFTSSLLWFFPLVSLCFWEPAPPTTSDYGKELVFSIEFTLDGLTASANDGIRGSVGLSSIDGGKDYRALMRNYWALCKHASETQSRIELEPHLRTGSDTSWHQLILSPDRSWWDWFQVNALGRYQYPDKMLHHDDFPGDAEVEILSSAVSRLKDASFTRLNESYDLTQLPQRPFAEVGIPTFFYVDVDPHQRFDISSGLWSKYDAFSGPSPPFADKVSAAVHRAGFRRSDDTDPFVAMTMHARGQSLHSTSQMVAYATVDDCSHEQEQESDHRRCWNPSSTLVVDCNNARLAIWVDIFDAKGFGWSTALQDGTCSRPDDEGDVPPWASTIGAIEALLDVTESSHDEITLVLTGGAWSGGTIDDLMRALPQHPTFDLFNEQEQVFTGSKAVAQYARLQLDSFLERC